MKLLIKYCPIWDGYDTKALEVSREITSSFTDVEVEVIEGARGEFSVIYQDDPPALIYSMAEKDRLPTNNEITSLLVRVYGLDNLSFFDLNSFTKVSLIIFMILGKIEIIAVIYLIKRFIFRE